jgi:hypothetical protein
MFFFGVRRPRRSVFVRHRWAAALWVCGLGLLGDGCRPRAKKGMQPQPAPTGPKTAADARAGRKAPQRASAREAPPRFAADFVDKTLRVNVIHRGTASHETYKLESITEEGRWPGSHTVLRDPDDYGLHYFQIVEKRTGRLLFSRGYGSLFSEWQTCDEARTTSRAFSESIRFPRPRRPFVLKLHSRRKNGQLQLIQSFEIDPQKAQITPFERDPRVKPYVLHRGGPSPRCLDILIIGDGYPNTARAKLRADGKRFARVFFENAPFSKHKKEINIFLLHPPSTVDGISEPRKGIHKKTPLGLSFNALGSPRYLMTTHNRALRRWAAHAPYDQLYLMANTSRYGGGGIYNLYSTFPADNTYSEYVFIHEFGHAFGGLGDEYYTSPVATNEMYPPGVEPWEPNLTRFLRGRFKWKKWVADKIPIPTPPQSKYGGKVGLFEGAGYTGRGMYRPALDCKMFSKAHGPFCPVCQRALSRRLTRYTQ